MFLILGMSLFSLLIFFSFSPFSSSPEGTVFTTEEIQQIPQQEFSSTSENLNQLYHEVSKEEVKEKTSPTVVEEDEEFEEVILEDDFILW